MLSPPTQIASAPRPMSEPTASRTAAEPSTFASSSSMPSSLQTDPGDLRAGLRIRLRRVPGDPDLPEPGVQPPGHPEGLGHRLHRSEAGHVGRMLPRVVAEMPTPAATGSLTIPKTCRTLRVPVGRRPPPGGWASTA